MLFLLLKPGGNAQSKGNIKLKEKKEKWDDGNFLDFLDDDIFKGSKTTAAVIKSQYNLKNLDKTDYLKHIFTMFTDIRSICPSIEMAKKLSGVGGDVYFYRLNSGNEATVTNINQGKHSDIKFLK